METEGEVKKRIIQDMAANAPAVRSSAIATAHILMLTLNKAPSIRLGKPPQYTADYKERHSRLISEYHNLCITCNPALKAEPYYIFPDVWKLDKESRPLRDFNLKTQRDNLAFHIKYLDIRPASIHLSARGMLSTIVKLFDSLSKRTQGKPPEGSLEGMFFYELVNWIVIELPSLKFDTKEDLEILKARRMYCDNVQFQVFVPDSQTGRNNPMCALSEIIASLDAIIEASEDLIQVTIFHKYNARVDDAILAMAAQAFQVLHLTIEGDKENEGDLPVCLLLDDTQTYRPKINELKQKRLGHWLKTTLLKAGIRNNDFIAHQSISFEDAMNHLHGEYIDDTPCTLPPKLRKNPNHSDWGHWEFMLTNLDGSPRDISATTKNIQHIYRDILKLYSVRELLTKFRQMSPIYGEVWSYNNTTGKAMLSMLFNIVDEMTKKLNESLGSFFNTTIALFDAKFTQNKIKMHSECWGAISATRDQYTLFTSYKIQAAEQLNTIKLSIETIKPRITKTDKTKYPLMKTLVEFIESGFGKSGTSSVNPKEYEILKKALNEITSSILSAEATSSNTPAREASSSARQVELLPHNKTQLLHWVAPQEFNHLCTHLNQMFAYGLYLLSCKNGLEKGNSIMGLALELKGDIKAFTEYPKAQQLAQKETFKKEFITKLHSKDNLMSEHRTYWKVLVANVLIALTGIGLFAIGIHYLHTGHVFFAKTQCNNLIQDVEKSTLSIA
ncbi:MAG: hypothetical protein P4L65_08440 [Legionella sp.]|nr:hypothetical protein [Legionella sp.]